MKKEIVRAIKLTNDECEELEQYILYEKSVAKIIAETIAHLAESGGTKKRVGWELAAQKFGYKDVDELHLDGKCLTFRSEDKLIVMHNDPLDSWADLPEILKAAEKEASSDTDTDAKTGA